MVEIQNQRLLKLAYLIGNYMKFLKYIKNSWACTAKRERSGGFAILYVMIIIAIILAVSLATINLISKEMRLARVARESLGARSAADTGLECMLMMGKAGASFFIDPNGSGTPTTTVYCGRDNNLSAVKYKIIQGTYSSSMYKYEVEIDYTPSSIPGPCFEADLVRDISGTPAKTTINIFGYNTCDSSKLGQQVQRGIIVDY